MKLSQIVIATDGSAGGTAAVRLGGELAKASGSRVTLVHVVLQPTSYGYGVYPLSESTERAILGTAEQILARAAKALAKAGVEYTELIIRGTPSDSILELADSENADLIVVGHRGLGAFGRLVLGSVSNKIVHKARCAVLIAPAPTEEKEPPQLEPVTLDEVGLQVRRWEGDEPTLEELHAEFAEEGLGAIVWSQTPGHVYDEHMHLETQVLRCAGGSLMIHTQNGEQVELTPGDMVRIPAFMWHTTIVGPQGVACLEARQGMPVHRPNDI